MALFVVGFGDFLLTWFPPAFGNPEWEFGTVVASFSGLPLVTMGLAAMVGSALARGIWWQLVVLGWLLVLLGLGLMGAYGLFLLDVPLALRADEAVVSVGVRKAIVKTTLIAVVFIGAYFGTGIGVLRRLNAARKGH